MYKTERQELIELIKNCDQMISYLKTRRLMVTDIQQNEVLFRAESIRKVLAEELMELEELIAEVTSD